MDSFLAALHLCCLSLSLVTVDLNRHLSLRGGFEPSILTGLVLGFLIARVVCELHPSEQTRDKRGRCEMIVLKTQTDGRTDRQT